MAAGLWRKKPFQQSCYVKHIIVNICLDNIFLGVRRVLSIPEGVSVATVIIDGVDVAPAGLVRRTPGFPGVSGKSAGITTRAPKGS